MEVLAPEKWAEFFGRRLTTLGDFTLMMARVVRLTFRRPFRTQLLFQQMEFIGVKSWFIILLTGTFTGMVFALQTYRGFAKFGSQALVGAISVMAITRELGPVLTSLMVTARAGSAMAAELGTMRVTEQVDALHTMAVDPVHYLLVPRIVAATLMLPFLTILFDFVGTLGCYFVAVPLLGVDPGDFTGRILELIKIGDVLQGLFKSTVFGFLLASIGCYRGFTADGGAKGVGEATVQGVVFACITILVGDYFLTALLFAA
ncbi:MAG: ABC transporter permease [Nitrospirae bacterium]|nr:ABC transporter permease [Nitrospirota bacterium]